MDEYVFKYRWYLIFILIIVIVAGIGVIWWNNVRRSNLNRQSQELTELKKQNDLLRQELSSQAPKNVAGVSDQGGDKININTADLTELDKLPGIGPARAADIIGYREQNGKFQSIEELKNISGIGDKTFENLKDLATIGDSASSDAENQ